MLRAPKNKKELVGELNKERDFNVLGVHNGPPAEVAKEIAKHSVKAVTVIVIQQR
jgi:hypothetical protein